MAQNGTSGTIDTGNAILAVTHGALDVHTADIHHFAAVRKFHRDTAVASTLAVAVASQDTTITLVSGTGFVAGDSVFLGEDGLAGTQSLYIIISVATNVLSLDRPVDLARPVGTDVHVALTSMQGLIGTVASPIIYHITPPADSGWHITRLILTMTHSTTVGDLGKFGDLTALTNGVLLRILVDGQSYNVTNWKDSADIKVDFYDVEFDTRSGNKGTYGTSGRGSFYKLGMVIALDGATADAMEVVIQDDLTSLDTFVVSAQGHIV